MFGAVIPSFAQSEPPSSPVTIYNDTHDGVLRRLHRQRPARCRGSRQPGRQACVGISQQLPVCADAGSVVDEIGTVIDPPGTSRQKLPQVVAQHDENGTAVGIDNVGVRVSNDGRVCPVVSTQEWICVGGDG